MWIVLFSLFFYASPVSAQDVYDPIYDLQEPYEPQQWLPNTHEQRLQDLEDRQRYEQAQREEIQEFRYSEGQYQADQGDERDRYRQEHLYDDVFRD